MKTVYMINGFLESGKTQFISFTLGQQYFQVKGKTLLILCEEGENEYEPDLLAQSRTEIELIENEEDFNPAHLTELEKKHKPERIIIEYNGMWNYKNMKLPWYWKIEQQITTIDGSTFPMYYTNMRSLLAEMIRKSEMIIFNRCDEAKEQLSSYKRNIKAVNPSADVIFEDEKGEIDEIFEEDLPYDLNQELIVLDNQGYGIWYLDSMDHLERYVGKKLQFVAMVLKPENFPKGYFVPGRMAMTCCADDMAFLGYTCEFSGADGLRQREWVKVTAVVAKEYWEDYNGEGPVLHAVSVEKTRAPKEEIISFS
ncbi:GTPase [Acetatifactor muris]|uniref:CobW/HypB/UreG, nucleotide-binding domain n=1 Tax=Acetatifactor muris TaxID=879566 RepID=A0A2K4ZFS5_9FIRM|nr:GTP-binding protein [Acetatifactor muris]MCR2047687.1 GTPase [Acetatifactor muris]SOY29305.1 CobW/HypB/UreG, nucleotide-binding domain [Acetatifactor muris]